MSKTVEFMAIEKFFEVFSEVNVEVNVEININNDITHFGFRFKQGECTESFSVSPLLGADNH